MIFTNILYKILYKNIIKGTFTYYYNPKHFADEFISKKKVVNKTLLKMPLFNVLI